MNIKDSNSRLVVAAHRPLIAIAYCGIISGADSAEAAIVATATLIKDPGAGVPFAQPDAALGRRKFLTGSAYNRPRASKCWGSTSILRAPASTVE